MFNILFLNFYYIKVVTKSIQLFNFKNNFLDPAPPNKEYTSINNLSDILLNENFPLWDRYKAMFSLRNFAASTGNGVQAVEALTQGNLLN